MHEIIPTVETPATAARSLEIEEPPAEALESEESWRTENNLLRPQDVDWICANESSNHGGIVAGLIPQSAIAVMVGDSGLGKSPLAYQIGLCVAAGIPFLGMETEQGLIVYLDYENGLEESRELRDQLLRFLELPEATKNFLVWTPDQGELNLEAVCKGKPKLVIVDSIRSHDPHFEKSEHAGEKMKDLNRFARTNGLSILVIHHPRKPGENGVPSLGSEKTQLMLWLKETAGHSSIINQSHTRIGVDLPDERTSESRADTALILRWHRRIRGEAGPLYLERVCDEDGEPLGYQRIADVKLLGNGDQIAAFKKLTQGFTFKEARQAYGRADDPTRKFLVKCMELGLIRQTGRGRYERIDPKLAEPGNT